MWNKNIGCLDVDVSHYYLAPIYFPYPRIQTRSQKDKDKKLLKITTMKILKGRNG